ncbi:hypothetical protein ABVT39_015518 [Epinephelus coioides]
MDSRSCNFTAAETNALLEGVRCHYDTKVGSVNSAKGGDTNKKKNDVWILITENVNATGSSQRRITDQIKFRWKNLKARATKDHVEAKNPQTGNKPFKGGDYTDVVLDIIGGEKSQALHGIQGVVGDGEPGIEEESQPVPPEADPESTFILNLSSVTDEEAGSSLAEPAIVATGSQRKGLKRPSTNKDDDYKVGELVAPEGWRPDNPSNFPVNAVILFIRHHVYGDAPPEVHFLCGGQDTPSRFKQL